MKFGKSYNFVTIAPTVLGGPYKSMKLIGITSPTQALKDGYDVERLNALVYTALNQNIVALDGAAIYYFQNKSGDIIALAENWIVPSSIIDASDAGVYVIKLIDPTASDIEKVKNALTLLNINNVVYNQ